MYHVSEEPDAPSSH